MASQSRYAFYFQCSKHAGKPVVQHSAPSTLAAMLLAGILLHRALNMQELSSAEVVMASFSFGMEFLRTCWF
jgi:hypothetical protein